MRGVLHLVELLAVCCWTILQVPFAAKRPNNALDEGFELLGPLQTKRGATHLSGPLPPVYLRNVPTLAMAVVVVPLVAVLGFVLFALTRPTITDGVAATILLGGSVVFVGRGAEIYGEYFRDGGYREHSPRSVLLGPFKLLVVVGLLFVAFPALEARRALPDARTAVLALAVGKLCLDVRRWRIDNDEDRRTLFAKLYGSKRTEIDPEPVETPDEAPVERVSMSSTGAAADAVGHGLRYGFLTLGFFVWGLVALGAMGGGGRPHSRRTGTGGRFRVGQSGDPVSPVRNRRVPVSPRRHRRLRYPPRRATGEAGGQSRRRRHGRARRTRPAHWDRDTPLRDRRFGRIAVSH